MARERGKKDVVKLLAPPLHWAAEEGNVEEVRALLEAGADKDAKDEVRTSCVGCGHANMSGQCMG